MFKEACRAAGVPGSAHGVRKIATTRAAENGATVAEVEAIFGWHGGAMASRYTREVNRVRLAKEAMHKLANDVRTSIPAPLHPVRAPGRKNTMNSTLIFQSGAVERRGTGCAEANQAPLDCLGRVGFLID